MNDKLNQFFDKCRAVITDRGKERDAEAELTFMQMDLIDLISLCRVKLFRLQHCLKYNPQNSKQIEENLIDLFNYYLLLCIRSEHKKLDTQDFLKNYELRLKSEIKKEEWMNREGRNSESLINQSLKDIGYIRKQIFFNHLLDCPYWDDLTFNIRCAFYDDLNRLIEKMRMLVIITNSEDNNAM